MKRHTILAALALCAAPAAFADTATFLHELEAGKKCYEAYQTGQVKGGKNWKAYAAALKPAVESLSATYNVRSWKDYVTDAGKRTNLRLADLHDQDADTFLGYVSQKKGKKVDDADFHHETELWEKTGSTYFLQFKPMAYPKCAHKFRLSVSIDETLDEAGRYQELARILVPLLSGSSQYVHQIIYSKIESPEMVRNDPILIQFCYQNDKGQADMHHAEAIIKEVNDKLHALKLKSAHHDYPAAQERKGLVSVADYSVGYSFGAQMCSYFDHYQAKAASPKKAVESFAAFWKAKVGEFEKVWVGDLSHLAADDKFLVK